MFRRAASQVVVFLLLMPACAKAAAGDEEAAAFVEKIGTRRGLCVVLGDTPAELALAIARCSELTLFLQSNQDDEVAAARRAAEKAGLLGTRVYVQKGPLSHINLASDLADAVIVRPGAPVSEAEAQRVLRPEGKAFFAERVIIKPYAQGTDEWTHPYHGPDNNPQSLDQVARRPYLTHFMATPWYCPLSQMTVVSGGRMFKVFGDRSSARPQEEYVNTLLALSAFNGAVLWKRPLTAGFMIHRNTLIATPQTLYLADDTSCKLIDAANGQTLSEIVVPPGLTDGPVWKWMALEGNVLYALVGEKELPDEPLRGDRIRGAGWPWWKINKYAFGFGRTLLAFDASSHQLLWRHHQEQKIDSRALCLKDGRLYFYCEAHSLNCLDAETGKPLWKNADEDLLAAIGTAGPAQNPLLGFASTAYMKASAEALYFAGPQRPRIVAASTRDGKLLWKRDGGNSQLVLRRDAVYALGEGRIQSTSSSYKLAPLTGEVLAEFASRDRCTRATGCVDSIFTRGGAGGSTAVFDVTSSQPKLGVVSPMRPACTDGVVVSHGLLYWGPWMCRCDLTQLGVISLGPGGDFDYTATARDEDRLESYAMPAHAPYVPQSAADWPTYRRDNRRSVVTSHITPPAVQQIWDNVPPHEVMPTAPIAAAGLVLVSGADGLVRALDAKSGDVRWTVSTGGGAIKYPPAIADGRAYLGGADGWVYCLEATTGRLVWRFRAAPQERMIPVYGTLTSTWAVGSGVLVDRGVVYAAAGISNFDGTHVFALDAVTGRMRWQNNTSGDTGDDLPAGGVSVQGHLLLHNDAIYMAGGNQLVASQPPASPVQTSVATFLANRSQRCVASYALKDGTFSAQGVGRGKDLYIRGGEVRATGFPLYWRPEDDHFLSPLELETPAGVVAIATNSVALLDGKTDAAKKPSAVWTHKTFEEIAAVAVTKNALLVSGLDRDPRDYQVTRSALTAVSLADGQPLWTMPLDAAPTAWGLAIDRDGRIVVTLTNGHVICFAGR